MVQLNTNGSKNSTKTLLNFFKKRKRKKKRLLKHQAKRYIFQCF